ncbi:hypothetical protein CLIB1423_03S07052 [[Candida] railenensis]|uniref:WHIM1 domain-containing protein n=1 Tax=[Candida] railenensis TaxID=45579 RepID=A0A9P0VXH3_9ASCO|nr:hypothetical protein CLIB1423_03S07052 [[Candida] railenensis]
MDTSIDPSISEQVFHVPTSPSENSQKNEEISNNEREELPNVFRLNDYVAEHQDQSSSQHDHNSGEVNTTAAAALNMIHYGFENDIPTDTTHSHDHDIDLTQHHSINQFSGIGLPFDSSQSSQHLHQLPQHQSRQIPLAQRQPVTMSRMHVVPYSPNEKPKRLGRPRRHIHNHTIPEDNSIQNVNESMVSKFRFDFLPIQGPGSRGGKLGGRRAPRGRIQSTNNLNSGLGPIDDNAIINVDGNRRSSRRKTSSPADLSDHHEPKDNDQTEEVSNGSSTSDAPEFLEEKAIPISALKIQVQSKIAKRKANELCLRVLADQTRKPKKLAMFALKPSRTTVLVTKSKIIKSLPGPLIGLSSSLYDDNVMLAKENKSKSTKEKIAFGYPVLAAPHAKDISIILMFLNKYKDIVFGKEVYYIGPHDFEIGLSLTKYFQEGVPDEDDEYVNYRLKEDSEPYDRNFVSPLMTILFCKLLGLVLNKKKDISLVSQKGAIGELRSQVSTLGLPNEWTNTSNVLKKPSEVVNNDEENERDEKPVDTNSPEILETEKYSYQEPIAIYNPFRDAEFEKSGLKALTPVNRLIMLRTLVQWSISNSESLKSYINENASYQDVGGERSTYYVARSITKGFKNAEDASKEAELRISKRSANKKASTEPNDPKGEEIESVTKYVDPLSDPLSHPLRWRIDDMCIADIGFNVGRFYLCRMADADGGGLSSLRKMKNVYTNFRELKDIPSSFKLYVEDVHQMIVEDFTKYGIEFDERGNEVESTHPFEQSTSNWYEVAGNAAELKTFIDYVSEKLKSLPSSLHKQSTNFVTLLSFIEPLITNQESAMIGVTTERITRKREEINYNDISNSTKLEEDEDSQGEEYLEEVEDVDMEDEDYSE